MNETESNLPKGWISAKLTEIAANRRNAIKRGPFGSSIRKEFFVPSGYKVYEQKNAIYNDFSLGKYYINKEKFEELRDFEMVSGDIIISCSGTIGRLAIVPENLQKGIINQALLKLTLHQDIIDNKYFAYLFSSFLYKHMLKETRGSAMQNISSVQALKQILFPLAPLIEQRRIVARIEELFSHLDAGVEALQRAQAQLRRYRQAVLKAAVEGRLTEEWRKAHPHVEPAKELLVKKSKERGIKAERDQNDLCFPNVIDLPQLPEGWTWSTLSRIGELKRGISKHRPRDDPQLYGGPYPFIQTGDVRHASGILGSYTQTYSEEGLKQSRLWPKGTLLITIAANIADTAILGFDACFPDSIVGFLTDPKKCNIQFVELFVRTAKEDIERYAPATAQKNINLSILSEVAIPYPLLEEQDAIVNEAEYILSIADEAEKVIEQSLKRADRLRQSILKRAFEGRLVPLDPSDEPASLLLERIKNERAKAAPKRGKKNSSNSARQKRLTQ